MDSLIIQQCEDLKCQIKNIIEIVNTDRSVTSGVRKTIIHQSKTSVVELTNLEKDSEINVKDLPFDSELMLADGEIYVNKDNKLTILDKLNRHMSLFKGDSAKGLAKKDSSVITLIKTI